MLYIKAKVKVRPLHGDTDFFDIVAGVQQEETLAPYLFIICRDEMLWTSIDLMKENGFRLSNERRYRAQTITDADYAGDIGLLANIPAITETLLHSLEQTAAGLGIHVKADKTEYTYFNQRRNLHTKGRPLKLVNVHLPKKVFHGPRKASKRDKQRYGKLLIVYKSYESQTRPIR